MKEWVESVDNDQEIQFDGDCISLEMPEDSLSNNEGWEIMPTTNPLKVIKYAIAEHAIIYNSNIACNVLCTFHTRFTNLDLISLLVEFQVAILSCYGREVWRQLQIDYFTKYTLEAQLILPATSPYHTVLKKPLD